MQHNSSQKQKKKRKQGKEIKMDAERKKAKNERRQQNENERKKACESRASEAGVVGHVILPTLTRLTDTLNISHWTINRPVSCARANAKEIELVT